MYKVSARLSREGFTLVELLVVIAIIGVLATLLFTQLGVARSKARDTKRIADVKQLQVAVEQYYDDNAAAYPTAISIANLGKYVSVAAIPKDPLTQNAYYYSYSPATSPTKYHMYAELENKSPALSSDADINSTGWSGDAFDASNTTTSEACTTYTNTSKQCVYDLGQK